MTSFALKLFQIRLCAASTSTTAVPKEKRSWFHSLTRRKKSDSALTCASSSTVAVQLQNNNNEPLGGGGVMDGRATAASGDASESNCSSIGGGALRKRKDKKNMFSRIRKKMGLGLSALRNWHSMGDDCDSDGGTADAMYEFLAPAIRVEPTVPFTHDYMRFIRKKWLSPQQPNHVMYKACSEMLK